MLLDKLDLLAVAAAAEASFLLTLDDNDDDDGEISKDKLKDHTQVTITTSLAIPDRQHHTQRGGILYIE